MTILGKERVIERVPLGLTQERLFRVAVEASAASVVSKQNSNGSKLVEVAIRSDSCERRSMRVNREENRTRTLDIATEDVVPQLALIFPINLTRTKANVVFVRCWIKIRVVGAPIVANIVVVPTEQRR